MQAQNDVLKQQLQEAQGLTVNYVENITALEQQMKASQFLSFASSFSRFTMEEFKELAFKIKDDHKKLLVELFEQLNEIQDT